MVCVLSLVLCAGVSGWMGGSVCAVIHLFVIKESYCAGVKIQTTLIPRGGLERRTNHTDMNIDNFSQ